MATTVVNLKTDPYDVYIGRQPGQDLHFGNPFSHVNSSYAKVRVTTRADAVRQFEAWVSGRHWEDLEPERRKWIVDTLHTLKGKVLGCFCKPQDCHGDILAIMADAS